MEIKCRNTLIPDGLIGPATWAKCDARLAKLAKKRKKEVETVNGSLLHLLLCGT